MTDSPADQLTAAAQKLRHAATADYITPPPWISLDGGDRVIHDPAHDTGNDPDAPLYVVDEPMDNPSNAEYIALMHPDVGLALADWLDDAAEDARQIGPDYRALAVARQILGQVTQ